MMDPRQQTLTPPTRRVRHASTGDVMEFPVDATDDDIHAAFRSARASQQQGPGGPVVQTFLDGLQEFQQPASSLPNISGGSVIGLNPEQTQSLMGTVQQSNQDSIRNRIMQQKAMQEAMEREKDRAQQIKLEQQRLKNDLAKKSYEQEFQKAQAETEFGRQKEMFGMESKEAREMADYTHQLEALSPFTLSPGQERFDPVTMESTSNSMNDDYAASLRNRGAGRGVGQQPRPLMRTYTAQVAPGDWREVTEVIDPQTGTPISSVVSEYPVAPPSSQPKAPDRGRWLSDYMMEARKNPENDDKTDEELLKSGEALWTLIYAAEQGGGNPQPGPQPGPTPGPAPGMTFPTPEQQAQMNALRQQGKETIYDYRRGEVVVLGD